MPIAENLTKVVGADFKSLVASHDKPDLLCLLVAEETDIASAAFFPFGAARIESEQFGPPVGARVK